jgi:hypothetical protein
MPKYIPTITPDQTNEEYSALLKSLGVTPADFTEYFNSLFPLTPTVLSVATFSADDVSLDNDSNEGLGDEGFDPNVPTGYAGMLS